MQHLHSLLLFCLTSASLVRHANSNFTTNNDQPRGAFTYDKDNFYLNGSVYQIIGGQMDPQRVPRPYWNDRLAMARAMGLNTIFSYLYWNRVEPQPGAWNFDGDNDIAAFIRAAAEEDINVVLRPGPFIGAEHEFGGLPSWLIEIPGMKIRSSNAEFVDATQRYIDQVAGQVQDLQSTRGGPLLMVQIENEYSSFGADENYSPDRDYGMALERMFHNVFEVPLYTTDSGKVDNIVNASVPNVLCEIDGQSVKGFKARQEANISSTSLGPLMNGEYYTTWFDGWGWNSSHVFAGGNYFHSLYALDDIEYVLKNNHSISFYIFHGGTNWAFDSSSFVQAQGSLISVTTSYDYGAPLDESGRPSPLYQTLQGLISSLVPNASTFDSQYSPALTSMPTITMKPLVSLWNTIGNVTLQSPSPVTMESLNQSYGFVLYEHTHNGDGHISGVLSVGDKPRDRILVYVNGEYIGVQDLTYNPFNTVNIELNPGDTLRLLIENLGRVSFNQPMRDQRKGIVGNVTVGTTVLRGWDMTSIPLENPPNSDGHESNRSFSNSEANASGKSAPNNRTGNGPTFYVGEFSTPATTSNSSASEVQVMKGRDTFLDVPRGIKGMVWVNNHNLGRYWMIGPQQSLYLPGCFMQGTEGDINRIVVLELEPHHLDPGTQLTVNARKDRVWGNNFDPDYPSIYM